MSVKITGFNVTNHWVADDNSCNSYKSHSIAMKIYELAYLMMFINLELVRYSKIPISPSEDWCLPLSKLAFLDFNRQLPVEIGDISFFC